MITAKNSEGLTEELFGSKLHFNEEEHKYSLGDKTFISVTEFIGKFFPKFEQETEAELYSQRLLNKGIEKTKEEILETWNNKRDYGSDVHNRIESYLCNPSAINLPPQDEMDIVKTALSVVRGLHLLHRTKAIYPEAKVYNTHFGIAGTIDLLMIDENNNILLGDWKTSNTIYTGNKKHDTHEVTKDLSNSNYIKYCLQLNTYRELLRLSGRKVGKMYLIHIKPEGGVDPVKIYDVPDFTAVVNKMLEEHKND